MIWLATNDGLCSFDGFKFNTFYSDEQTSKPGSNIIQDQYGRIWYCNFDGIIYYVEKGKLKVLPQQKPLGYHQFSIIDDQLIYLVQNQLCFLDLETLKKTKTIPFKTRTVLGIQKWKGTIYIYSDYLYEIKSATVIKKYNIPAIVKEKFNGGLLSTSADGLLLVSRFSNDYCHFKQGKFEIKQFSNDIQFIQNIKFENGYNWLCTTKGAIKINLNGKNTLVQKYFEDFNISAVFKDKDGGHWITTLSDGLLYVPNFNNLLYPTISTPTVLNYINGNLFYGTLDEKIVVAPELKSAKKHKIIYKGNSNHNITTLDYNKAKQTLLFTSNSFKIADRNGKVNCENIIATKQLVALDDCYYAYAASGNCGLIKIKNSNSPWNILYQKSEKLKEMPIAFSSVIKNVRGKSVAFDSIKKTIYFATNLGLYQVENNTVSIIKPNNANLNLSKIYCYQSKIYALSTNNKLIEIDSKANTAKVIYNSKTNNDLLIRIKLIDNKLYLLTSSSVIAFDLKNKTKQNIFNINSTIEVYDIIKKDNALLFATSKGLLRIENNEYIKPKATKFLFQKIFVNGKETSVEQLKQLTYDQSNIEIQYAVIGYLQNPNHPIYYKINNNNWFPIDNSNRNLSLSSLASGDYTISFKTSLTENPPAISTLKIKISKPLWAKWWFILFLALLGVFGVHLFYKKRIRKIQARNQIILEKVALENSLTQSKIKAIKSQMNPHFFYNALNTLQSYILSNDKKQALNYLSKFSNLTRTILEMTEKETISIAEEIKTLTLYLEIEKARFENDFEFEIIADNSIDLEQTKIPSMLLQPYVENAAKHGLLHKNGLKKLIIHFSEDKNFNIITIDDNGIGRKKSNELNAIKNKNHQSFATVAMQNRIDLLNQNQNHKISIQFTDKTNQNQQAIGTTVSLTIPKNLNL